MREEDKNKIDLADFDVEDHDIHLVENEYTKIQNVFSKVKDDVESLIREENKHLLAINKELRREIEERKKAEIKLSDQLLFLEALMDAIPNPIFYKDEMHRIVGCNSAFIEFVGKEKDVVLGKNSAEIFRSDAEVLRDIDCEVLRHRGVLSDEIMLENAKGEMRHIVLYKSTYLNTRKDACGVVGMMVDITELRQIMSKQKEQEQILIHQSRMAAMGEMIGNIAHQWRQPISTISLLIQDINDAYEYGELDQKYLDDFSDKTLKQIRFMSETIDDFRDYLRPDKSRKSFSLVESVRNSMKIMDATFKNNNVRVIFDFERDIVVPGYKNEFSQVLLNIFKNVKDEIELRKIKEGMLRITLEDGGEKAILTIEDNAGGIPEAIIDKIFNPYFSTKEEFGGTGIGLHMSKNIIETNMDGSIRVENTDLGAKFTIELRKAEH
jgi:PAS domain S-box-containing protein